MYALDDHDNKVRVRVFRDDGVGDWIAGYCDGKPVELAPELGDRPSLGRRMVEVREGTEFEAQLRTYWVKNGRWTVKKSPS